MLQERYLNACTATISRLVEGENQEVITKVIEEGCIEQLLDVIENHQQSKVSVFNSITALVITINLIAHLSLDKFIRERKQ